MRRPRPVRGSSAGGMSRPVVVVDGEGGFLADFAEWASAHAWAHAVANVPGRVLPVVVWDLRPGLGRRVREVGVSGCRPSTWETRAAPGGCDYPDGSWQVVDGDGSWQVVGGGSGQEAAGRLVASRRELALRSVDVSLRTARSGLDSLLSDLRLFGDVLSADGATRPALVRRAGQVMAELDTIRRTVRGAAVPGDAAGRVHGPERAGG